MNNGRMVYSMRANVVMQSTGKGLRRLDTRYMVPTPPYSSSASAGGALQGWSPELQQAAADLLKMRSKSPLLPIIRR